MIVILVVMGVMEPAPKIKANGNARLSVLICENRISPMAIVEMLANTIFLRLMPLGAEAISSVPINAPRPMLLLI